MELITMEKQLSMENQYRKRERAGEQKQYITQKETEIYLKEILKKFSNGTENVSME